MQETNSLCGLTVLTHGRCLSLPVMIGKIAGFTLSQDMQVHAFARLAFFKNYFQ